MTRDHVEKRYGIRNLEISFQLHLEEEDGGSCTIQIDEVVCGHVLLGVTDMHELVSQVSLSRLGQKTRSTKITIISLLIVLHLSCGALIAS